MAYSEILEKRDSFIRAALEATDLYMKGYWITQAASYTKMLECKQNQPIGEVAKCV